MVSRHTFVAGEEVITWLTVLIEQAHSLVSCNYFKISDYFVIFPFFLIFPFLKKYFIYL